MAQIIISPAMPMPRNLQPIRQNSRPNMAGIAPGPHRAGRLATADPTKYRVVDGQLYLNFDETVQQKWLKDIPGFIEKADKAWPGIDPKATFDNQ